MAGVHQHGWKATSAVRSGYDADTLPDRYRSVGRCRSVRIVAHPLATVIVAEEYVDDMTFIY